MLTETVDAVIGTGTHRVQLDGARSVKNVPGRAKTDKRTRCGWRG
jgi:hypothetical protein